MSEPNVTGRLEAFCDGVFAIALTLLVIDIKAPATHSISSTQDLWHALRELVPVTFAFLLSFGIVFITWVNHHGTLKMVNRSTPSFIYANGFMLLTVAFIPFPTSLLGEFIGTAHAGPAVFLYNAVLVVQAMAWIVMLGTALGNRLAKDAHSEATMRANRRNGYFAFVFYALLAIAGLWWPVTIAIVTTMSWIVWLILGIRLKHA